ncbi:MAG: PstS family phosphate ABC transporter substrate-binding protein [Syntrophobacteraceae bacterium]
MKKISAITLFALILITFGMGTVSLSQPLGEKPGERLIAAGSGVNLGITRLLASAFMKNQPQVSIEVPGSIGTRGAIRAAADGAISLGLISRPLTEDEQELGLTAVPYARTAIVIAAHPSVADEGISSRELIDIYRGTKTRWKDDKEIIVQSREKTDSGFNVLMQKIPGFEEAYSQSYAAKRWSVYFTDQDANRALSTKPGAIGVTDIGMINTERLNIKVLKIDGLLPGAENVSNGQYPFVRDLSFIYRKGNLPEAAKVFLDFVRSEEGAKILRSYGYFEID